MDDTATEDKAATASYVDAVYAWLHGAISELQLPSGSPLRETQLATHLGVSRTPVREALHRLEGDGLVQRSPNNRFVVATLTVRDVNEACDAMQVLDCYLFGRVAERIAPADAERLKKAVEDMRRCDLGKDVTGWAEADNRFHQILASAVDNSLLSELVKHVRRRIHRFWLGQVPRPDGLSRCSEEHAELATAIGDNDVEAIAPVVERHIAHMRESLLLLLQNAAPFMGAADWPPPKGS